MKTLYKKIDPEDFRDEDLDEACEILKSGGLVAFPTETVYGLGGDAERADASEKIYAAKGRPSDNPLIVHIADMDSLYDIAEEIPEQALQVAKAYWPGPLTMIFKKKDKIPDETTGGLDTVAVRMPSHPVARALIRRSGVYIAAPSANTSGRPSPTKACHVKEDLDGKIDMIIDSGPVGIGIESSILDMSVETPMILRPGYIDFDMFRKIVPNVTLDPSLTAGKPSKAIHPKAPGMKYRHYAPKGNMVIVAGHDRKKVAEKINQLAREHELLGARTAVIASDETRSLYEGNGAVVLSTGSRNEPGSVAARLFDILREMDHIGAEYIISESFDDDKMGFAIMNRMLKAAAYHVIKV